MSISRAIRLLLAFISLMIVAWSFFDVGRRSYTHWREDHAKPVTLTIIHWGDQAEDKVVADLIDAYLKTHPNIQVNRINAGNDFRPKIKTMFAAGTPPDLFYLPPDVFPEWASLGLIRPIDDLIADDIKKNGESAKKLYDDFFPIIMDAYKYDASTGQIGHGPQFGLPKDFTTAVFYVNVDLFKKAGLRVPYDGWAWDEFEDDCRKITALSNLSEYKNTGTKIYGATFDLWPDTLRQIFWSFGADFFGTGKNGDDFRNVTFDSPASQEAMQFVRRLRVDDKIVYNAVGVSTESKQEFFAGTIGCIGPYGRWMTPRYASIDTFKWDCVPLPAKKKEFQHSQIFYTAWAMSQKTAHPAECYDLMKFLCGGAGALVQSRLGLAVPPLKSIAMSDDFLNPPGLPKIHSQVFLDEIPTARLQQLPTNVEFWTRLVDAKSKLSLSLATESTLDNANEIKSLWLNELDSPLRQREWPAMRWDWVISFTAAVVAALIAIFWFRAKREKLGPLDRSMQRTGYAFITPWVIGFVALTLGPMVVSLLLSFTRWSGLTPMSSARAVGGANFRELFTRDPKFYQSLRVTVYFVLLAVPLTQIAALAVAILMNVRVRGIAVYRTVFFVPSLIVVSVVGAVLWRQMYNPDFGIVNAFLRPILSGPGRAITLLGVLLLSVSLIVIGLNFLNRSRADSGPAGLTALLCISIALILTGTILWLARLAGTTPPDWLGQDAAHWAVPAFVLMSVWGVGGAMILYLAGLKGIPASLYEAATIDGAGRSRQFWNVTLPMLSPLIFYNVVMGIIGSFQVFVQAMVMTAGEPNDTSLFYVLNLYRQAFEFHNMGYASAMAWVLFVILLGLTILIFRGSKSLVYYEGLKT